jgi:hypothetical protein
VAVVVVVGQLREFTLHDLFEISNSFFSVETHSLLIFSMCGSSLN